MFPGETALLESETMCNALTSRCLLALFLINLAVFALRVPASSAQTSSPNLALHSATRVLQDSKTQYQHGIDLYEKNDFDGAVKVFKEALKRDKNNVTLWHYLGLAYDGMGKFSDARKAHENAARRGESLLTRAISNARGPNYLDSLNSIASQLRFASSSATRYLQLTRPDLSRSGHSEAMDRALLLRDIEKLVSGGGDSSDLGKVIPPNEATTKVRILSKPEPMYTEQARQNQTTGTVILRAILGRDGRVHLVIPIKSLPDGLTGRSILAALQIRFEPAIKDGHPVSVAVQLEYNFNLY